MEQQKFNIKTFKKLAKEEGIKVSVFEIRKQMSNSGRLIDFDVEDNKITRVSIATPTSKRDRGNCANIYFNESSKNGLDFKNEKELVNALTKY